MRISFLRKNLASASQQKRGGHALIPFLEVSKASEKDTVLLDYIATSRKSPIFCDPEAELGNRNSGD
jgi:hypothetical protein